MERRARGSHAGRGGATGAIGKAVAERSNGDHKVVAAGYSHGEVTVDMASPTSIEALFERVGPVEAVVCTAVLFVTPSPWSFKKIWLF